MFDIGLVRGLAVAPHAGAWIETSPPPWCRNSWRSPLTQGRGLKHADKGRTSGKRRSPLTQGRGLKQKMTGPDGKVIESPLTQGRGLKLLLPLNNIHLSTVAPHAGAWIETSGHRSECPPVSRSPLTQGRGLKLHVTTIFHVVRESPLTQGRGLKRQGGTDP